MSLSFDGVTKRISIVAQTTVGVRELWSRWVEWQELSDNSKYLPAMTQVGGNDIDLSTGTKIPIYAFLTNGWRVKPQESSHTLNVTDGILLVDGGGDPFVNTTGSFVVRINYQQPVQAISFATSGEGGLTIEQATQLAELWKLSGLKSGSPLQVTPTSRTADDVSQSIGEANGVVTVTRT